MSKTIKRLRDLNQLVQAASRSTAVQAMRRTVASTRRRRQAVLKPARSTARPYGHS